MLIFIFIQLINPAACSVCLNHVFSSDSIFHVVFDLLNQSFSLSWQLAVTLRDDAFDQHTVLPLNLRLVQMMRSDLWSFSLRVLVYIGQNHYFFIARHMIVDMVSVVQIELG